MRTAVQMTENDRERIAKAVAALRVIARDLPTYSTVATEGVARARWVATDALTACLIGTDLLGPAEFSGDVPLVSALDDLPSICISLLEIGDDDSGLAVGEFITRCGDVLRGVSRLGIGA